MEPLLIAAALTLSFANGANDNFKGFATVWGSDTLSYRRALTLATVSTLAGCVVSIFLAQALVHSFSGKGLVADAVVGSPLFITSVAIGAGLTILLATRLGFPVSTTHALIGGLIGAALAQGSNVNPERLAGTFIMPLLLSPFVAALLGATLFRVLRATRAPAADCVCVAPPSTPAAEVGGATALASTAVLPRIVVDSNANCDKLNLPARVSISRGLDRLHVASAMAICFARGVNDAPKLAALLIAGQVFGARGSAFWVATAMVIGGWFFSARVARTMSYRVTRLDPNQGVSANLITALLVLVASNFGMPVSTTHVSVGTIAGVGASANTLDKSVFRNVLLSWLATLPISAAAAFAAGWML
jgi:inorganic phosphate transporter, PiT family